MTPSAGRGGGWGGRQGFGFLGSEGEQGFRGKYRFSRVRRAGSVRLGGRGPCSALGVPRHTDGCGLGGRDTAGRGGDRGPLSGMAGQPGLHREAETSRKVLISAATWSGALAHVLTQSCLLPRGS